MRGGLRLKFVGSEKPIDQRTSYNVFAGETVRFVDYFEVEFDLALHPPTHIGYIIRIKNEGNSKIFNLFYDGQGNDITFKFNEEGKSSLIVAKMDKEELQNLNWFKMRISLNLKSDSVYLTIHNKTFKAGNLTLPNPYNAIILFGKSDFIIDVPSFSIKNFTIRNNQDKKNYFFPLRETEGNIVHEKNGKATGQVSNPEWLMNDAYHWRYKTTFKSKSVAGANFNPRKKEIYYFNKDTILSYNLRSGDTQINIFDKKCPVDLILGTNFIDTIHNKLYSYETYYENPYNGFTVASLDLNSYQWTGESREQLTSPLHHHGSYFNPSTGQYTIWGGFGRMHYNNDFYSYDMLAQKWNKLDGFIGDFLSPRYFSSIGYLKKTNSVYIFGGMGNESGEQTVGRKYYYDLHKIDLNTKVITKLWEINWGKENIVPVRGMIILNDSCFYTLCYPEHFSKSFLKLYRFSLNDGKYEILGDSIPIFSDKITTNANLYYDSELNNLYAIVQEFDNDISSDLKVYSLAFPPITEEQLKNFSRKNSFKPILIILFFIAGGSTLAWVHFRRKKNRTNVKQDNSSIDVNAGNKIKTKATNTTANSVYLFGDFMVRDRKNKDITYLFSAQLKQVFCLILQYSTYKEGISSQRLSEIIWPGKPADKVKNSRGVTINHLRKAISEIDGIELIYEKGSFKIIKTEEFYCDYSRCLQIISSENLQEYRDDLLTILNRGKFLNRSDHPLYDSLKESLEQKLEPVLLLEMSKCFEEELYQMTIDMANAIFNIDPLNDIALSFQIKSMQNLKMTEEAQLRYQTFVLEYKKTMGKNYPHPFKSLY